MSEAVRAHQSGVLIITAAMSHIPYSAWPCVALVSDGVKMKREVKCRYATHASGRPSFLGAAGKAANRDDRDGLDAPLAFRSPTDTFPLRSARHHDCLLLRTHDNTSDACCSECARLR